MFQNILDSSNDKGSLKGVVSSGVVIDNNDPEKLDRVKVRVSDLHSGRAPGDIPWSLQYKFNAQGHTANLGSVGSPVIGAKVLIFYPEDDEHDTYYVADFHDKSTQIQELLVDYPHCYGHIDASGNLFLINTFRDTILVVHLSGSYAKFNQNGSMEIAAASDLNMYCKGNFNLKADGIVSIDGSAVYINSNRANPLTVAARTKPNSNTPPDNSY